MPIETDADRAELLADHEEAIYTPSGGSAVTLSGIFEAEYVGFDTGRVDIDNSAPAFMCRTSDAPFAAHGDTLEYDEVSYTVVGVEPDGSGMTLLILSL